MSAARREQYKKRSLRFSRGNYNSILRAEEKLNEQKKNRQKKFCLKRCLDSPGCMYDADESIISSQSDGDRDRPPQIVEPLPMVEQPQLPEITVPKYDLEEQTVESKQTPNNEVDLGGVEAKPTSSHEVSLKGDTGAEQTTSRDVNSKSINQSQQSSNKSNNRREMLLKWKQEKALKKKMETRQHVLKSKIPVSSAARTELKKQVPLSARPKPSSSTVKENQPPQRYRVSSLVSKPAAKENQQQKPRASTFTNSSGKPNQPQKKKTDLPRRTDSKIGCPVSGSSVAFNPNRKTITSDKLSYKHPDSANASKSKPKTILLNVTTWRKQKIKPLSTISAAQGKTEVKLIDISEESCGPSAECNLLENPSRPDGNDQSDFRSPVTPKTKRRPSLLYTPVRKSKVSAHSLETGKELIMFSPMKEDEPPNL